MKPERPARKIALKGHGVAPQAALRLSSGDVKPSGTDRAGPPGDKRVLPDRLAFGLEIISIGINPSVYSIERGFNFARPGNRFWPAFNAAGLVPETIEPGKAAIARLQRAYRIGFTDIVRRATERSNQLTDEDFRAGALALKRKLLKFQPRIAWFQGVTAYAKFLRHAEGLVRPVKSGLQPERIGATRVFVTPNPSGANPAANPRELLAHFIALKNLRDVLVDEP